MLHWINNDFLWEIGRKSWKIQISHVKAYEMKENVLDNIITFPDAVKSNCYKSE